MTIHEALAEARIKLQQAAIDTAVLDAEVLLAWTLKKPRVFLFAHDDQRLTPTQHKKFATALRQRRRHVPVAYIVGRKEFYGREFIVTRDVLIPRPETELLVEAAIEYMAHYETTTWHILDLGTGSGAIAVSLALAHPGIKITASDQSLKALATARRNAQRHQARIQIRHSDLLSKLPDHYDVIIANLPYVPSGDRKTARDIKHEPARALYSGADGLTHYRRLFIQLAQRDTLPVALIIEFDPRQKSTLQKLVTTTFPTAHFELLNDGSGRARCAVIEF